MDIYKLSDDLTGKTSECAGGSGEKLMITGMKEGVRNPERVNVYINDKFAFSLDVSQVVDLKIKVGRVISDIEFEEFKRASEFGKLYQRALEWVLIRPRSEKECRDYLRRKLFEASSGTASRRPVFTGGARLRSRQQPPKDPSEASIKFSDEIVERLKLRGYLDDRRFAEYYVENRFSKKGVSMRRLKIELTKKGISKEIILEVFAGSERNDKEEILKIIAKKRGHYTDEKLTAYLCRQGFSYDLVREIIEESSLNSEE